MAGDTRSRRLIVGYDLPTVAPSEDDMTETILCIPGPWASREALLEAVVVTSNGSFLFAGAILACPSAEDHVPMEFAPAHPALAQAFEIAGQGKLDPAVLADIRTHGGVAYLRFPTPVSEQRGRMLRFTEAVRAAGGFAVKVETAGIAHDFDTWRERLTSGDPFDLYRSFVVLVGGENDYHSCGMQHFELPDCRVSRSLDAEEAAETMNRFNDYQIVERPALDHGHTFSLRPDSRRFRMLLVQDERAEDDPFRNRHGIWELADADG